MGISDGSSDVFSSDLFLAGGDFVDFVKEHNAVLLGVGNGAGAQFFFVDAAAGFFFRQELEGFLDGHFLGFFLVTAQAGKPALELLGPFFPAGGRHYFHLWRPLRNFDFNFPDLHRKRTRLTSSSYSTHRITSSAFKTKITIY